MALPEDPGDVFADRAYRGQVFAQAVTAQGGTPRVVVTSIWARSDPASQAEAERWLAEHNGAIHRVRCRIETIFGTWKCSYGFRRMRWRGLINARLQTHLTAIAYNLKRDLNILSQVESPPLSGTAECVPPRTSSETVEITHKFTIRAQISQNGSETTVLTSKF